MIMSLIKLEANKCAILTLSPNRCYTLYNDNRQTSSSNELHKAITLDPTAYQYVALQETGMSLNAENIPIPSDKVYLSQSMYLVGY